MKQKVCKEDEILNPKTKRCVKRTGKIGMVLVEKQKLPTPPKTGLYIPSYLLQQQQVRTLSEFLQTENPSTPAPTLRWMRRFLEALAYDVVDTTSQCSWHYRREKKLRKEDVRHTLQRMGLEVPKHENKEFTAILSQLVGETGPNASLLSRALLPFTHTPPSATFVENIKVLKPASSLEKFSLRYL